MIGISIDNASPPLIYKRKGVNNLNTIETQTENMIINLFI